MGRKAKVVDTTKLALLFQVSDVVVLFIQIGIDKLFLYAVQKVKVKVVRFAAPKLFFKNLFNGESFCYIKLACQKVTVAGIL